MYQLDKLVTQLDLSIPSYFHLEIYVDK